MTEPTQKSLEEARELRAALSLGRDEYDAFMLVEEAEFDCKIALALDAARQEGRGGSWPEKLTPEVEQSLARSIGNSAGVDNHNERAQRAWATIRNAVIFGAIEPPPSRPQP